MSPKCNHFWGTITHVRTWNNLPTTVTSAQSLHSFWRHLKAYLLQQSFPDIIVTPVWTLQ